MASAHFGFSRIRYYSARLRVNAVDWEELKVTQRKCRVCVRCYKQAVCPKSAAACLGQYSGCHKRT